MDGYIIPLESSWEVEMAAWLDKNQIAWIRPKHLPWLDSTGKKRKYFPDFYLPDYDIYLDPKNPYQIQLGKEKLDYFKNRITLLYGKVKDIQDNLLMVPLQGLEPQLAGSKPAVLPLHQRG